MKFLVCIKQVVDTSKMEVDPETGRLKRNNANSIMNPVDLNALEAALSLRDRIGGTVTVITMDRRRRKPFFGTRLLWGLMIFIW